MRAQCLLALFCALVLAGCGFSIDGAVDSARFVVPRIVYVLLITLVVIPIADFRTSEPERDEPLWVWVLIWMALVIGIWEPIIYGVLLSGLVAWLIYKPLSWLYRLWAAATLRERQEDADDIARAAFRVASAAAYEAHALAAVELHMREEAERAVTLQIEEERRRQLDLAMREEELREQERQEAATAEAAAEHAAAVAKARAFEDALAGLDKLRGSADNKLASHDEIHATPAPEYGDGEGDGPRR